MSRWTFLGYSWLYRLLLDFLPIFFCVSLLTSNKNTFIHADVFIRCRCSVQMADFNLEWMERPMNVRSSSCKVRSEVCVSPTSLISCCFMVCCSRNLCPVSGFWCRSLYFFGLERSTSRAPCVFWPERLHTRVLMFPAAGCRWSQDTGSKSKRVASFLLSCLGMVMSQHVVANVVLPDYRQPAPQIVSSRLSAAAERRRDILGLSCGRMALPACRGTWCSLTGVCGPWAVVQPSCRVQRRLAARKLDRLVDGDYWSHRSLQKYYIKLF